MAAGQDMRHVVGDAPRVMVADGSRLERKLIRDVLVRGLPEVEVFQCLLVTKALF